MSVKASQLKLHEHSEVKIRLLKLYLDRYLNILTFSKYVGDIYVFDLFCGEGIYNEGGKGSPIIILEVIKEIHKNENKAKKKGHFICHFNDFNKEKINKLWEEIKKGNLFSTSFGRLSCTSIDYKDLFPQVLSQVNRLRNDKAFIFIDPYGYKDISVKHIVSLLRNRKTEVLLFLPTQFMFRFEKKGAPESLKKFINELVPKDKWPNSSTGIDFIENLTEYFRKAVGDNFFVDSFIITRDKNQFFSLFFFTSHIYGFDRMLEAKWEIDKEEGRGWYYEKTLSLFNSRPLKPNTVKFEEALISFLKEDLKTNGEIYEFTIRNGHLSGHANDILTRLQNEGIIEVQSNSTTPRRGSFFINYKDYRDNYDKIKVGIKWQNQK